MSEPIVMKLSEPVQVRNSQGDVIDTITELRFKSGTARDLRGVALPPTIDDLLNLAARLSGQPTHVIDQLSMSDGMEVVSIMGELSQRGRTT